MEHTNIYEQISAIKKFREATTLLFNYFSKGCLYNCGKDRYKGKCMHAKGFFRKTDKGWDLRRSCTIMNCPRLDD